MDNASSAEAIRGGQLASSLEESVGDICSADVTEAQLLEDVLALDPSGLYVQCDTSTQSLYRAAVLHLSALSSMGPVELALQAVRFAAAASDGSARHVGYHLIGPGRPSFETLIGSRLSKSQRWAQRLNRHRNSIYLTLPPATALAVCTIIGWAFNGGIQGWMFAATLAVPATHTGIVLVQHLLSWGRESHPLPSLSVDHICHRCSVVLPLLVRSAEDIDRAVQTIRGNAAENPLANCDYWLATDFADASTEHLPSDAALLVEIRKAVETLQSEKISTLHFHRDRRWVAEEGVWSGWERKRGKLLTWAADPSVRQRVQNDLAVVLDVDSVVKNDGLRKLYATALHPLNQQSRDGQTKIGIWQPDVHLQPERGTLFEAWLYEDAPPVGQLRPSFWERVFGWDMYFGKGLVNFRSLEAATAGAISDNSTLSHDHLEGLLTGTRYCANVVIAEDAPQSWLSWKARQHRWMRGDTQLLRWIIQGRDPFACRASKLSRINRFRLAENIVSVLLPTSAFLAICWSLAAFVPTVAVAGLLLSLALLFSGDWLALIFRIAEEARRPASFWQGARQASRESASRAPTIAYEFLSLPERAWLSMDAVCRSLFRMFVSRKKLLEWRPAGKSQSAESLSTYILSSFGASISLVLLAATVALLQPDNLALLILLTPWFVAPAIFWAASKLRRTSNK